ncbi:heparinase II/III domain-containing protein [Pseudoduganella chitinolytica]|uniref:Heparinase II/III family protein n=1 Tax=Pseudoduganella chitinolytica TaxID=34070 RepID=A0ABY8BIE3_9BURK|nr:heparinase II/III family protein [Pseudoduganella chitinolytica]WEF35712.1 heparinase II/III family protein [Pseudoduganella chitinolytica]
MTRTLHGKTRIAAAIALLWVSSAYADMPREVRTGHPRLLATQADLDRVRQEAAVGPLSLPAKKGKLVFTLNPKPRGTHDLADTEVFGQHSGKGNRFYFRYSNASAPAGTIALEVAVIAGGADVMRDKLYLKLNADNQVEFDYNVDLRQVAARVVGGGQIVKSWPSTVSWSPAGQQFSFFGHLGDRITNLTLSDNGVQTWHSDEIDLELHRSWRGFLANAWVTESVLKPCDIPTGGKLGEKGGCDRNEGGRATIIEAAQRLTTAFRMTEHPDLFAAAKKHIDFLLRVTNDGEGVDRTKGGEWDMAARVGAMGLYYDWLYDRLTTDERAKLAKAIRDTIAAPAPKNGADDLVHSICGYSQTVVTGPNGFDCAKKPVLVVDGWKPTIASTYVSGHTQSANAGVALGLLAIGTEADGNADVRAMLNTIYDHFAKGFWPARDFYSADGGSHALFAYSHSGGGDTAERLVVWRRALNLPDLAPRLPGAPPEPAGTPTLAALPALIYPYIYGLRSDGSYPARGDYFRVEAGTPGEMAAAAMAVAADKRSAFFYDNYVVPNRNSKDLVKRANSGMFWERLLYPSNVQRERFDDLKLSRHFRNAGNVMMRDTWDFAKATLLEFKSASFISMNHQHMDQNSYSLYYKAPLLLDSGHYDKYGSNHWHNYYIRSIAHNTITVLDPEETFSLSTVSNLSVDGGQWLGNREERPQLRDIQPGGKNALDGVVTCKNGRDYSYVTGNASKAYVNNKLDPVAGFLRSMVYLHPANERQKPKVLVFDSVRPAKDNLEITTLLHSVNKPTSTIAATGNRTGRYVFGFKDDVPGPLTIRNGEGMVTVQTLLPATANVVLSGGKGEGDDCTPAEDKILGTKPQDRTDCRFLVRTRIGDKLEWQNYAKLEKSDNITMEGDSPTTDMGAWRVEISPKTAPRKGATQYFLNVLHVDDIDNGGNVAAAVSDTARLLSADGNAVAVAMADGQVIVFHGGAPGIAEISWTAAVGKGTPTLVVGLDKNAAYKLVPDGATRVKLVRDAAGTKAPEGVIEINRGEGSLTL